MANRKWFFFLLPFAISYLPCRSAWAKPKEDVRNELPAPINLQAVVLQKTITLSWQWPRPEELPIFTEFGYELKRMSNGSPGGKTMLVPDTAYADEKLAPGSYSYMVRVYGVAKEKGKRVVYVSDWAGPVSGVINIACARAPTLELSVEQTQQAYASVASLRFHLKGQATVDPGCTLGEMHYHLDTGTGITHGGDLTPDTHGHFDTFINAFGPDDEIPTGRVSFSISASAADEAGPTTSDVYTIDVELRNPFAPH